MKKLILTLACSLSLAACNYSNEFTGTYNNNAASLSAYSSNVSRYCISLNLTSGSVSKSSFISAQAVYDANDYLKPMQFNTKGAQCSQSLDEYLVGSRNTQVLNISIVTRSEMYGANYCRFVSYKQYQYQESITFDIKSNKDDSLVGTFNGTGQVADYTDFDHPVSYGNVYYCGNYPPNYPGPGYPGPGYPNPYPGGGGGYPNPYPGGGTHVPGGGPHGPPRP